MRASTLALAIAFPALAASSECLAATEFTAVQETINPVMQPKTPVDTFQECANNAVCKAVADRAATYLGVPPGMVSAALAIVPQARREGEEGRFTVALPPGYQYCHSQIKTVSVVPATGDRASLMGVSSIQNGLGVYTWTPKRGNFSGRSWIEAEMTVYGVRNDIADQQRAQGKCTTPGKVIMDCRGASGINHGKPACGSTAD